MKGRIFDIKKFAIHDGPGIRTTVFFKGCPLRCRWCHNPESVEFEKELAFHPNKCIGCGRCIKICPNGALSQGDGQIAYDEEKCELCGKCAEECPAEAIVFYGRDATIDEVVKEVLKDKPFYDNSGGGVTLSGGEPLMHHEFAAPLLEECKKKGLHCVLDTSGCSSAEIFRKMVNLSDAIYFDVKAVNEQKHRELTGVSNKNILENLRWAATTGKPLTLRVPLVPGLNDTQEDLDQLAALYKELKQSGNVEQVEILPYHRIGSGKYSSLRKEYTLGDLAPHPKKQLREIVDYLKAAGVDVYCSSLAS